MPSTISSKHVIFPAWFLYNKVNFNGNNIRYEKNKTKSTSLSKINSRFFSNKVLKNLLPLYIASRVKLNRTFSINKKKCKIRFFI